MGHSHSSSSHKRLRSISSIKNCGEFTEVVDLEFSDSSTEPANKLSDFSKNMETIPEKNDQPSQNNTIYPKELLTLEEHVKEVERRIEKMSPDEFFIYFPTLKDDLHNCWQKVYSIKDQDLDSKLKKYKVIDHIRELLKKLNEMLQRRDYRL